MPRYVAFLRGVSPTNASMPELRRCFEAAGFSDVRTLLSSGNVAFSSRVATAGRPGAAGRAGHCAPSWGTASGRSSVPRNTFRPWSPRIRSPGSRSRPRPSASSRFCAAPVASPPALPVERDGASILKLVGAEAFTAYVPSPKGPAFMALLERTFGTDITTRTLGTVEKCARA
jgi:hypothetical protein